MTYIPRDNILVHDYYQRLFRLSTIRYSHLSIVVAIVILTILIATALSLPLGFSTEQFHFSDHFLSMLPLAIIAAVFEELGWRTYGADSLLSGRTLFSASLLFADLWGIWHIPLFFINQTYQQSLFHLGWAYVVNFFVSIFPATLLMNWFYYKSKRSIPAGIFFHFLLVATAELLQTAPQTKWIITGLLTLFSLILIVNDRHFFFSKKVNRNSKP